MNKLTKAKRICAMLITLCLLLTLLPTATIAAEETGVIDVADAGTPPVCDCVQLCISADEQNGIEAAIKTDCRFCGVENACLTLCMGSPLAANAPRVFAPTSTFAAGGWTYNGANQTLTNVSDTSIILRSVTADGTKLTIGAGVGGVLDLSGEIKDVGGTTYTLTAIGDFAFSFKDLTSVTIPATVTSIGRNAFAACASLTTVDLSNASGLNTIGDSAFHSSGLTSITIPAAVTSIGKAAFTNCTSLATVDLSNASGLDTIGSNVFGLTAITSITIPAAVKSIEDTAFGNCKKLTTVDLSNASGLNTIGEKAFYSTGITSITIPAAVTSIEGSAFRSCTNLTTVDLSNASGLKTIGDSAFLSSGLTSITIPAAVTSIETNAFAWCASLATAVFDSPSSLKTIGDQAFGGTSLTSIAIPAAVKSIGDSAFSGCASLATAVFDSPSSFETIGKNAFSETSLTSIAIPASVKSIGDSAFGNCKKLTTVDLSNASGLNTIGDGAFLMTALTGITVPATVTSIGDYAFSGCASLATVEFSNASGLNTIGDQAFAETRLTSITIPASVTDIGDQAFQKCPALKDAIFEGVKPAAWGTDIFKDASTDFVLWFYELSGWSGFTEYPNKELPKIITDSLAAGVVGSPYSHALTAQGGAPLTWNVKSGSLPKGLALQNGAITGTPELAGSYAFTLTVNNGSPFPKEKEYIIEVASQTKVLAVSISPKTSEAQRGDKLQFKETVTVEGGANKEVIWSVDSTLSSIDNNGILTISAQESKASLTVTAVSKIDKTVKDTAIVTIKATPAAAASPPPKLDDVPKTGDETNMIPFMILSVCASGAAVVGVIARRQKKKAR